METRSVTTALQVMARNMGELAIEKVPEMLGFFQQLEKMVEATKGMLRARAIELVEAQGSIITDKGTKVALVGDWKITAVPLRTGLDPKKLEATLRAKQLDPREFMQSVVTFKVDTAKVAVLCSQGKLTDADIEACTYEKSYRITVDTIGGM